jgi:HSP20 family molecular chaperone IbpA
MAESLLAERAAGGFMFSRQKTDTLIVPIDIQAAFESGVLTLTMPKAETVNPKKIQLTAG